MLNDELKDVLAKCYKDTGIHGKTLFPERFRLPYSPMHRQIFDALDDDRLQKVVIKAPRGMGKTSIVQLAYASKKILFREKRYIVPVSNTSTQAVLQSENLKDELVKNEIVRKLFGDVQSDRFSKEQWLTSTGTLIMPRGSGQQIRGLLYRNHRPDLIICDDLEDEEGCKNEETRKSLKRWFYSDLMNAVDRHSKDWKIVVIGTLLHEDSLLANLLQSKGWHPVDLELFDDNGKSNWPEFLNDEEIQNMIDEYRLAGQLSNLYREYRGVIIAGEDAAFRQSYFKYYNESELNPRKIESVVILDPAKTVTLQSAESGIIGWGIDVTGNRLLVRDVVGKKMHPDELYDELFAMCERLQSQVIGIEVTSLHDWIMYPLQNEMARRGLNYELVELQAVGKKEDRAAWLVPLYRKGLVYHNKSVTGPLEMQMLSYPYNKRWDCLDAAAYIVKMLKEGGRYFLPALENLPARKMPNEEELKAMEQQLEEDEPPPEVYSDEDFMVSDAIVKKGMYRII